MKSETKNCQNCKQQFVIEPDDFNFYEKIKVPVPKNCPRCRQQRRILFRNFKTLYKRNSDKSGKSVISMYSKKAAFPVWSHEEWWADDWDAKEYGRDYDFSLSFFEQFAELQKAVPHFAVMNTKSENCVYSNLTFRSKNCYLVFGCVDDENCAYGHIVWNSKDCFDNLYVYKAELCYECVDCLNSYRLLYSQECENCVDSVGLYDCKGCVNCIGCVGLKQKSYHIFNENVGKDRYEKFLIEHPLHDPRTITLILNKQMDLREKLPQRYFFGSHNTNVSGNHIYNSKNIHHSFDVKSGENSKYVFTLRKAIDTYDASFSPDVELCYEVLAAQGGLRQFFSRNCVNSTDIYYSEDCFNSHGIFGCVGLRSDDYCILNKKYSKQEYESLKSKIIEHMKETGEWGRPHPPELSAFAYNESIVNEYIPLTKEQALAQGFRWEEDIPITSGKGTIAHDELPTDPKGYSKDLLNHVLKCDTCSRNYRLIQLEVNFYKNIGLSLPRECFNCRHQKRMNSRSARQLFRGTCAHCGVDFQTSYSLSQQKEYRIFCDNCYLHEVG
ncbi:hypothetical protein MYX07_01515 [Patescibacteria group bacterium AH-259-L07]|nr:hypothetical protein [Patescibacteria group bacterium AH-259-L07]